MKPLTNYRVSISTVQCIESSGGIFNGASTLIDGLGAFLGGTAGAVAGVATTTVSGGTLVLVGATAFVAGVTAGEQLTSFIRKNILTFSEGEDDLYIKVDGKKIWPRDSYYGHIRNGEIKQISLLFDIQPGKAVTIELYDHDTISSDDLIYKFSIVYNKEGNVLNIKNLGDCGNGGAYSIDFELQEYSELKTSQKLYTNECLISNNGRYKLVMQEDGNLCIYDLINNGYAYRWGTQKLGKGNILSMEEDGNVSVIDAGNNRIWSSNISSNKGSKKEVKLKLEDSGKLVIYDQTNIIWTN